MSSNRVEPKAAIIERFARHVSSGKAAFFAQAGIDFVGGEREGVYLCDLDGKRLINCHCNGGVFNLGHRNPHVMAALRGALERYDIGNHHLMSAAAGRPGGAPGRPLAGGDQPGRLRRLRRRGDRPGAQAGARPHPQAEDHLCPGRLPRPHRAGPGGGGRGLPQALRAALAWLHPGAFRRPGGIGSR